MPGDQFSDTVAVPIDGITCRTAAVVTMEGGSALQADRQVAGLAEETELLAGVKEAEDGAREAALALQLLKTLDSVGGRPLLSPNKKEREPPSLRVFTLQISVGR